MARPAAAPAAEATDMADERADETPDLLPHEQPALPRTDLWIAAVFLVLGVAVGWLAFLMPTFTDQKGEIYTAPGLVPGFYGIVMVLLSVWLGVRAIGQGALSVRTGQRADADGSAMRREW